MKLDAAVSKICHALEEDLVAKGRELAEELARSSEGRDREPQLRNILVVANQSSSWALVGLFIRYLAARREIPTSWAEEANRVLGALQEDARSIAGDDDAQLVNRVHMELVRRTLGYVRRWYVYIRSGLGGEVP